MSAGTALITGAAGGLGSAIARRLASQGRPVVCLDLDQEAAQRTAETIGQNGGSAVGYGVDITDEASVHELRESLAGRSMLPQHMINAAGILFRGQLDTTDTATFRKVLDVNVTGAYTVTREFAADLASTGAGRVVNIASIAGMNGYEFTAYATSKGALVNLTRALVLDFWGKGVTVNAVCPGPMRTPMLNSAAMEAFLRKTPTRHIPSADEVAGWCAFLLSEEAANINGQTVVVDGGATAVFRYTEEEA
ncbi:SDR family NAD(P)-dependent oxidoreductase [Saccharopolyspora mangrovi]|uniref:SDR family NAD(P)-dependent oxidoreductase n=1 Tax=Saccharopolyspora mangrovi TaxID=3082379 RepID=A0ABU6AKA8_9PSEU|nr:SDR family NAD(P)-dependent oxidoreductase [Saccharopolyspora sp. S2-29]MEB3371745.1 SDR family NAD(P)-dependent oxidoreductase [Saccharopolyspora sp. S2-29]